MLSLGGQGFRREGREKEKKCEGKVERLVKRLNLSRLLPVRIVRKVTKSGNLSILSNERKKVSRIFYTENRPRKGLICCTVVPLGSEVHRRLNDPSTAVFLLGFDVRPTLFEGLKSRGKKKNEVIKSISRFREPLW